MTASDASLNAILLHEFVEKTEVEQDEINTMHGLITEQATVIERVWFTILDIDNVIAGQVKKMGKEKSDEDALVKLLRTVRNEFLKSIKEPNYFKS